MSEHLYRFRPSVLGKHQELENPEIYFSSLDTLNDPMEGLMDLFWSGLIALESTSREAEVRARG